MKWFERRQTRRREQERRKPQSSPTSEVQTDRRQADRRQAERRTLERRQFQRRKYFRVVYPPDEGPTVLNADYRVIDLAQKSVKFACKNGAEPSPQVNGPLKVTIQFRDGSTRRVCGKITRLEQDQDGEETSFVCMLDELIPQERVTDEQRYLLKNFPNFCRTHFDRRGILLED